MANCRMNIFAAGVAGPIGSAAAGLATARRGDRSHKFLDATGQLLWHKAGCLGRSAAWRMAIEASLRISSLADRVKPDQSG